MGLKPNLELIQERMGNKGNGYGKLQLFSFGIKSCRKIWQYLKVGLESKRKYTYEYILVYHFCPKFGFRIKYKLLWLRFVLKSQVFLMLFLLQGKNTLNFTSENSGQ